jgi:hypothetical protein
MPAVVSRARHVGRGVEACTTEGGPQAALSEKLDCLGPPSG